VTEGGKKLKWAGYDEPEVELADIQNHDLSMNNHRIDNYYRGALQITIKCILRKRKAKKGIQHRGIKIRIHLME
jgi:hypothetical protein